MIKTTDFYDCLCNELGYRIFFVTPVKNFEYLYKYMNPAFMHYIPTISESVAVGIITGINYGGSKGVVLIDSVLFTQMYTYIKSLTDLFSAAVLFISNASVYKDIAQVNLETLHSLRNVHDILKVQPCCLVINKGILSDG